MVTATNDERGQAITEFLIGAAVLGTVLIGGWKLFGREFNRFRCAYHAFEAAHAALLSESSHPPTRATGRRFVGGHVRVERFQDHVSAQAICGNIQETVALRYLESRELSAPR